MKRHFELIIESLLFEKTELTKLRDENGAPLFKSIKPIKQIFDILEIRHDAAIDIARESSGNKNTLEEQILKGNALISYNPDTGFIFILFREVIAPHNDVDVYIFSQSEFLEHVKYPNPRRAVISAFAPRGEDSKSGHRKAGVHSSTTSPTTGKKDIDEPELRRKYGRIIGNKAIVWVIKRFDEAKNPEQRQFTRRVDFLGGDIRRRQQELGQSPRLVYTADQFKDILVKDKLNVLRKMFELQLPKIRASIIEVAGGLEKYPEETVKALIDDFYRYNKLIGEYTPTRDEIEKFAQEKYPIIDIKEVPIKTPTGAPAKDVQYTKPKNLPPIGWLPFNPTQRQDGFTAHGQTTPKYGDIGSRWAEGIKLDLAKDQMHNLTKDFIKWKLEKVKNGYFMNRVIDQLFNEILPQL